MPKKKKPGQEVLTPEELVAFLDEHFTRNDPEEAERRFHEFVHSPESRLEDLFPMEEEDHGNK